MPWQREQVSVAVHFPWVSCNPNFCASPSGESIPAPSFNCLFKALLSTGLSNQFRTSWYCPTPQPPRGSKLLKPLPAVKGIFSCNCFKTNLLLVMWDLWCCGMLCSPSQCHPSHPPPSLDWRIQAFLTISLSHRCWDSSKPLAAHLHYLLQFFCALLRSKDQART